MAKWQNVVQNLRRVLHKKLEKQAITATFVVFEIKKELKKAKWPVGIWFACYLLSWGATVLCEPSGSSVATWNGYMYFVAALSTTVGLGDVSPITAGGQGVATFSMFFFPLFLAGYGTFIARDIWKIYVRVINGDIGGTKMKKHIPIITFQKNRTQIIVENILADERRKPRQLLLCFDADIHRKNPMQGIISGLSVKTGFKSEKFLQDACINQADRILVDTGDDNLNIALCVIFKDVNQSAHIVVAFDVMQGNVDVIRHLGDGIECVPTSMPELIARCLQDPGSSYTILDMVDAQGQTKYRLQVPEDFKGCTWGELKVFFKSGNNRADAIAAGYEKGGKLEVNPPKNRRIEAGMYIEYIRSKRFREGMIDWAKLETN